MYKMFPREIGTPSRFIVNSEQEFQNTVSKMYKYTALYTTVYGYKNFYTENGIKKINYDSAIIDRVFFDLDNKDNLEEALFQTLGLHCWLLSEDYLHVVIFSGGGFHIYLFTENGDKVTFKRDSLINAQNYFIDKLKLTNFDRHIQDNLMRLCRIVNTFNFKPHVMKWCVPLTSKQLNNTNIKTTLQSILLLSEKQSFDFEFFGTKRFDLLQYDRKCNNMDMLITNKDITGNGEFYKKVTDIKIPDCIKKLVLIAKTKHLSPKDRYYLILWLKENKVEYNETIKFLQETLICPDNFGKPEHYHCIYEEKQPYYIYRNKKYMFSCGAMRTSGFCNKICTAREELYYGAVAKFKN